MVAALPMSRSAWKPGARPFQGSRAPAWTAWQRIGLVEYALRGPANRPPYTKRRAISAVLPEIPAVVDRCHGRFCAHAAHASKAEPHNARTGWQMVCRRANAKRVRQPAATKHSAVQAALSRPPHTATREGCGPDVRTRGLSQRGRATVRQRQSKARWPLASWHLEDGLNDGYDARCKSLAFLRHDGGGSLRRAATLPPLPLPPARAREFAGLLTRDGCREGAQRRQAAQRMGKEWG